MSEDRAPNIVVLIPALNEEKSIGRVLAALPNDLRLHVIVADNGSTDATAVVARHHGAEVVHEPRRGYGWACLAAMAAAKKFNPDIGVFLDADFSDYPEDIHEVVRPIVAGEADMVIGSRVLGQRERGALLPQARFGNWLATRLIRLIWGFRYTDLGPFRAVRWPALLALNMQDKTYGWTVEMQIKALKYGLRVQEVPVRYRKRIGKSKVTGTLSGTIKAGFIILWTIFRYGIQKVRQRTEPAAQIAVPRFPPD
ncbi:MAG: glycosyltransferase family 2 protein [candidate division KSB1 bacterium]|nr:glycosyltransferase family 2 protein [candidate division KSB1 bacterium]